MRKNLEYNLNPMKTPTKHGRIECSKMTSFERFGTSVVPSVADISHFKLEILLPNQRCKFEKQYVPPLMNREFLHPVPLSKWKCPYFLVAIFSANPPELTDVEQAYAAQC
jgi:hypothetical protein